MTRDPLRLTLGVLSLGVAFWALGQMEKQSMDSYEMFAYAGFGLFEFIYGCAQLWPAGGE